MTVRVFGTEVYISPLFFLVISFVLFLDRFGLYMPALAAVVTHEAGHLAVMKRVGNPVKRVRLIPAAVLIESKPPAGRGEETAVMLAGAGANFIAGGVLMAVFYFTESNAVLYYAAAQIAVGIYNLIPVRGLDGGRLVLILLAGKVADPDRWLRLISFAVALTVSAAAALIYIFCGTVNPSLPVFAIYILILNIIKV